MPQTTKIAETDEGQLDLVGNELVLTDKTSGDPCALGAVSRNGGITKWNFKARRPDGSIVEIGYLYGKQDERYPGQQVGELEVWLKAPGQAAADTKVIGFRHDGPIFYRGVPPPQQGAHVVDIWSPSGIYLTQQQDDGNLVWYQLATPFDKGTVVADKLIVGP